MPSNQSLLSLSNVSEDEEREINRLSIERKQLVIKIDKQSVGGVNRRGKLKIAEFGERVRTPYQERLTRASLQDKINNFFAQLSSRSLERDQIAATVTKAQRFWASKESHI